MKSSTESTNTEPLLSRAAVAEKLGVCPHTVQRLTRRGLLPALVFNKRLIRYTAEAVGTYIKQAAVGTIAPVTTNN
jgi:hypothetical protein